jgi:hypothetical protein
LDEKGTPKKRNKEKGLPQSMDFNKAHKLWVHKSKGLIVKTAKYYGVKLTGNLDPCEGYGIAMAKQKAVSKTMSIRATKPYQRLFVDASGPHQNRIGGNKYWFQAVDDQS